MNISTAKKPALPGQVIDTSVITNKASVPYGSFSVNIPNELRALPNWFLASKSKIPYMTKNPSKMAKSNNPDTWATFEETLKVYNANRGKFVGMGFSLMGTPFLCVDIDQQKDAKGEKVGESPNAKTVMDMFHGTYIERSLSGKAYHVFIEATKGEGVGEHSKSNKYPEVELYGNGGNPHYILVTGDIVEGAGREVLAMQPQLDALIAEQVSTHQKKKSTPSTRQLERSPAMEDEKILDIIRGSAQGFKFGMLYIDGDLVDYSGDYSAADMALACMLAFYTQDEEQLERIMRGSALLRDKWDDRNNYLQMTICKAIAKLEKTYQPEFNKPWIYLNEKTGRQMFAPALLAEHLSTRGDLIFAKDLKSRMARAYRYESGVWKYISEGELAGLAKKEIPVALQTARGIRDVVELTLKQRIDFDCKPDDFDNDEHIINFKNGILDLRTMELLPHSKEYRSTIQIPVNWNPAAPTPKAFLDYMGDLCIDDTGKHDLLMQCLGVAISNVSGYRMKKALIMFGEGDTGKSQLRALASRLIGDNLDSSADLATIEERFGESNLYGKRIVGNSDMQFATVKQLSKFKQITGGDALSIEYKGLDPFQYTYRGLLWFCANALPRFGGDKGDHVYNRMMLVRCDNVIPAGKRDKRLLDKMCKELEGIAVLAVKYLNQVIDADYNYTIPDSVNKELEAYKQSNDNVLTFLSENIKEDAPTKTDDRIKVSSLYVEYKNWCLDSGESHTVKKTDFKITVAKALEARCLGNIVKSNGIDVYTQINWIDS